MRNSGIGGGRLHRRTTPRSVVWLRTGIVAAGVGTAAIVGAATASATESDAGPNTGVQSAPAAAAPAQPKEDSGQESEKAAEAQKSEESEKAAESEDAQESDEAQGAEDAQEPAEPEVAQEPPAPDDPPDDPSGEVNVPTDRDAHRDRITGVKQADPDPAPEPVELPEVKVTQVAKVTAPVAAAAPAAVSTPTQIDYGAGSGARVAVIGGAFGSPTAVMKQMKGSVCASPNKCDPIYYFAVGDFFGPLFGRWSINDGVAKLDAWIRATPGPKIAMGHSFGAVVISSWLRKYGSDPTAPSPDQLSFITLASPERRLGGYAYTHVSTMFDYRIADGLGIPADTRYRVLDTCRKWDGWCDWHPDQPSTSRWGMFWLHTDYTNLNLNDPANDVVVRGNVTYVLLPTPGWP